MKTSECIPFLEFMFEHRMAVLITGKPGIGKTDVVIQATRNLKYKLIIKHPVVDDPTDYKGMPWVIDGKAVFLPFGDLYDLIYANEPLVVLFDDLGQASPAVQAAVMQLLLARSLNGHKISDFVTFVACTNRRQDNAAVSGILAPVKSRFKAIVELEYNAEAWINWAITHNMPTSLVSFIQFRPNILADAVDSKEIVNVAGPRTAESVGLLMNNGITNFSDAIKYEAIKGAAGQAFAIEFTAFLKYIENLPAISLIFSDPVNTKLPTDIGSQYALVGAIADKLTA
ncbi:MAG TPA: ATP-binding protein, partial [Methylococcales bacterium]